MFAGRLVGQCQRLDECNRPRGRIRVRHRLDGKPLVATANTATPANVTTAATSTPRDESCDRRHSRRRMARRRLALPGRLGRRRRRPRWQGGQTGNEPYTRSNCVELEDGVTEWVALVVGPSNTTGRETRSFGNGRANGLVPPKRIIPSEPALEDPPKDG